MQNLYSISVLIQEYSDNEDDEQPVSQETTNNTSWQDLLTVEIEQPLVKTIEILPDKTLKISSKLNYINPRPRKRIVGHSQTSQLCLCLGIQHNMEDNHRIYTL